MITGSTQHAGALVEVDAVNVRRVRSSSELVHEAALFRLEDTNQGPFFRCRRQSRSLQVQANGTEWGFVCDHFQRLFFCLFQVHNLDMTDSSSGKSEQ